MTLQSKTKHRMCSGNHQITLSPQLNIATSPTPVPPDVDQLVLELDTAYCGNAFDAPNEADESHELTYVDIDTFLTNF